VLYKYQFGFRKNYSTSLALIETIDNILMAIDKGLYTCGVFIDFSKAFVTVNHKIILSKLSHCSIRGIAYEWFDSYLDLSWKVHINTIAKNVGLLSKIRHYVDLDTLRKIYFALIYPYLQYWAIVWGNTYKSHLKPLNILNNKALRLITFSHYRAHAATLGKLRKVK
jgi:hypothetical protein